MDKFLVFVWIIFVVYV